MTKYVKAGFGGVTGQRKGGSSTAKCVKSGLLSVTAGFRVSKYCGKGCQRRTEHRRRVQHVKVRQKWVSERHNRVQSVKVRQTRVSSRLGFTC